MLFLKPMVKNKAVNIRPFDNCGYPSTVNCDMDECTFFKTACENADLVGCAGLIMYDGWEIKDDFPKKL